jgi:DNA-binding transcriptional ArsR family regulator
MENEYSLMRVLNLFRVANFMRKSDIREREALAPDAGESLNGKLTDGKTAEANWTFLTNHSHVLICLAQDGDLRLRDVAQRVGITERAVHKIVTELEDAGFITREREGRRNHYEIHPDVHLRHPVEAHCTVRELLQVVNKKRAS